MSVSFPFTPRVLISWLLMVAFVVTLGWAPLPFVQAYIVEVQMHQVDVNPDTLQYLPDHGNGVSYAESFTVPKGLYMDWLSDSPLPYHAEQKYPFLYYAKDIADGSTLPSQVTKAATLLSGASQGHQEPTSSQKRDFSDPNRPVFPLESTVDSWLGQALQQPNSNPPSFAAHRRRDTAASPTLRMVYTKLHVRDGSSVPKSSTTASSLSSGATSGWAIVIAVIFSTIFVALAVIRFLMVARHSRWAREHGLAGADFDPPSRPHLVGAQFPADWGLGGLRAHLLNPEMLSKFPVQTLNEENMAQICDFKFSQLVEKDEKNGPSTSAEGSSTSSPLNEKEELNLSRPHPNPSVQPRVSCVETPADGEKSGVEYTHDATSDASSSPSNQAMAPSLPYRPGGENPSAVNSKQPWVASSDTDSSKGSSDTGSRGSQAIPPCSICLDDFEPDQQIRILPCHHTFHTACIDQWLTTKHSRCPLCKMDCYYYLKDHHPELFVHNRNHLLGNMNRQTWRFNLRPPPRTLATHQLANCDGQGPPSYEVRSSSSAADHVPLGLMASSFRPRVVAPQVPMPGEGSWANSYRSAANRASAS
ncbi:hypothetical protein BJ085DRAFT_27431 [Dimargaris cristalligena]|uniref:RING-type domain-containing protein n=1 Tax=Dimargaris cristalligena TaxID=215637 RepID=A0A4Q0A114_9FUNG|nr:hypothetical protein BJ085DRAFT_27431 [Dimargaris cristalligena]|eukprot:RKP39428.1 hypothetical protein BJ085DRAFT_27431 [Dimargaris cristalligena]